MSALIHQLFGLFGEPQQIAALQLIDRKTHELLSRWLRGCECVLRQLLLIEASALTAPRPRSAAKGTTRRSSELVDDSAPCHHDLDHPETWRVSFRVLSSPSHRASVPQEARDEGGAAPPSDRFAITSPANAGRNPFCSAWPLALRAEALLRAFNDPLPFARRLAARLHRKPHRAGEIVDGCSKPEAHHGVVIAGFPTELWTESVQTLRRWSGRDDSS